MKHILKLILLILIVSACSDNESLFFEKDTTDISIIYPEISGLVNEENALLTLVNRSTNETVNINYGNKINLLPGLYDCHYESIINYEVEGIIVKAQLLGSSFSVKLGKEETSFSIETYLFASKNDFIIREIFFTGTLRSTGKQYYGDGYVEIFNNTDHILYADGIALVESDFTSTQKYDYRPDIRKDTMSIQALYVIPGSGTDHPVMPGEGFILCDVGIDHRVANPNSFDLSKADYEWYDESNSPSNMDIDSETVPNLDKWYCYTNSFWVLHNRGFKSYAIARIPIGKDEYMKDYFYKYSYTMSLPAGNFYMEKSAYKLPNNWIVDGVNCSVETKRLWNILPPDIDAGWTHCGYTDSDANRYFKSIRRKFLYKTVDGRSVYKDTNNSTNDFNTECIPSLIELQRTATDAMGTPATIITYDGFTPVSE